MLPVGRVLLKTPRDPWRFLLGLVPAGVAVFLAAISLAAQTVVVSPGQLTAFTLQRPDTASATRTVVSISGMPFSQAVRVQTVRTPGNRWDIQLNRPLSSVFAANDVLAGEIWLRRLDGTNASALVEGVFERSGTPYTQSLTRLWLASGTNWTRFRFAFRCVEAYAGTTADRAQFNLRLGFPPQTVEIGGLALTNFGITRPLADFPNDVNYSGREPEAPWRAAAAERIERLRKADHAVEVLDADGFPVPGAEVRVRLQRHAFHWGSAVDGGRLLGSFGTASDRGRYQAVITNWFNKVVLENDLKWPSWESTTPNGRTALAALDWLQARGIPCRGHNLIWPGTNYLPSRVRSSLASRNAALVREQIDQHFTNVLGAVRGRLVDWDVMNEITHERAVQDLLGDDEMVRWMQLARNLDPAAKLFVNEYENLEVAGTGSAAPGRFLDALRFLKSRGAPLDGIGLQGHFGGFLPAPEDVYAQLDAFAEFGLPIQVTEFDVAVGDEAAQADYVRDLTTVAFSHPAVTDFLMWGFWAGQHWKPEAALFRSDWSLRPAGVAWSNLVFREWTTDLTVRTDRSGRAAFRGFRGRYSIEVRVGNNVVGTALAEPVEGVLKVPRVTLERPSLEAFRAASGGLEFTWLEAPSGYRIESSVDLAGGRWDPIAKAPLLEGGLWRLEIPPESGTRFYRLVR